MKCSCCKENERTKWNSLCKECNRERVKKYNKQRENVLERVEKLEKLVENLQKQFDSIDFEPEIDRKTLRREIKSILVELD